jgi:hypothetical protein
MLSTSPLPRRRLSWFGAGLLLLALLALSGAVTYLAGSPTPASATPGTAVAGPGVPRPDHVVVVMLENKDRASVIGSASAPYLTALAGRGATMTQSYGVTHPSQGNYVALFAGKQHGVADDACPQDLGAQPNLATQLEAAHLTFFGFSESLPYAGFTGCSDGQYRRKHNAWVDFSNVRPGLNQPFSAFPTDYARLPTISFVTPNMCSDMHDCPVGTGDAWLKAHLDAYAQWAQTHNSLLVVTFDENSGGTVNQIPTVIVGQRVRPGTSSEWMNHYTLLRTLEDAYGLAPLGWAANAQPLRSIWTA